MQNRQMLFLLETHRKSKVKVKMLNSWDKNKNNILSKLDRRK